MLQRRVLLILSLVYIAVSYCTACADGDDRTNRKRDFSPVDNPTYAERCGECHFAYLPELLPSGSWQEILSHLQDHNGTEVIVEEEATNILAQYLEANAAEKSSAKKARKIIRSLKGKTPTRITDVPYIRRKHHDVAAEVFQRKSVGSSSNCIACHTTAEQGVFDEDYITIPE